MNPFKATGKGGTGRSVPTAESRDKPQQTDQNGNNVGNYSTECGTCGVWFDVTNGNLFEAMNFHIKDARHKFVMQFGVTPNVVLPSSVSVASLAAAVRSTQSHLQSRYYSEVRGSWNMPNEAPPPLITVASPAAAVPSTQIPQNQGHLSATGRPSRNTPAVASVSPLYTGAAAAAPQVSVEFRTSGGLSAAAFVTDPAILPPAASVVSPQSRAATRSLSNSARILESAVTQAVAPAKCVLSTTGEPDQVLTSATITVTASTVTRAEKENSGSKVTSSVTSISVKTSHAKDPHISTGDDCTKSTSAALKTSDDKKNEGSKSTSAALKTSESKKNECSKSIAVPNASHSKESGSESSRSSTASDRHKHKHKRKRSGYDKDRPSGRDRDSSSEPQRATSGSALTRLKQFSQFTDIREKFAELTEFDLKVVNSSECPICLCKVSKSNLATHLFERSHLQAKWSRNHFRHSDLPYLSKRTNLISDLMKLVDKLLVALDVDTSKTWLVFSECKEWTLSYAYQALRREKDAINRLKASLGSTQS